MGQSPEDLDLRSLWDINRTRLEGYHKLVSNYAASTRQMTLVTIANGFIFLLLASGAAALARSTPASVATAIVGSAGAVLASFIANAVLKNAETSSREVLTFFSHPIEVERYLSAERLLSEIPFEQRAEALILIIRGLVGGRLDEPAGGE